MPHPRFLFVIADGGRARLVRRSPDTGDFVTEREIDGGEHLRSLRAFLRRNPPGRSFESATSARHAVSPEDPYRQAKEEFAAEVADAAVKLATSENVSDVVLVANARTLPPLRRRIGSRVRITGQLGKDLTKVPDHELSHWLTSLELAPAA